FCISSVLTYPPLFSSQYFTVASSLLLPGRIGFPNMFIKSFQEFRDPRTLRMIQSVASIIASQDETIDLFMETCQDIMLLSGGLHRNPCLLLMIAGLVGYLHNDSTSYEQRQIEGIRILREYFETELSLSLKQRRAYTRSPEANQKPDEELSVLQSLANITSTICQQSPVTEDKPERNQNTSVRKLKENTITICLLLEMICVVSSFLGVNAKRLLTEPDLADPTDATEELLKLCLSPCFALASWSGLIGQTANQCLQQLAEDCASSSVGELITRNADYLISSITLQLHSVVLRSANTAGLSPDLFSGLQSACQTMLTLFEHANFEILPFLRPMVRQVLSCLDLTYEHHVELFLPPLKRLVLTCRQWHAASKGLPVPTVFRNLDALEATPILKIEDSFSSVAERTLDNINKLVLDTRRMHRFSSIKLADDVQLTDKLTADSVCPDNDDMEPNSRVYPDELHIVEEVMLRCIHLTAANDPKCRILSMEVLIEGYLTLRDEQDLLLPLAHKIWSPLLARFRDRFAIVVEKAFQILVVLSNVAGDFLRSRARSDVIPSLLTFLRRGLSVSANASQSYHHLTSYRVQQELLARLGSFCSDLNLDTEALCPVVQLCALYLAENQPPGLRQAAFQSLKVIWLLDPGLVWLELFSQSAHHNPADVLPSPPNTVRFYGVQLMTRSKENESSGISAESLKFFLSELASTL
ncbi:hypothetical protein FGIG_03380, partial [Fasciola gigantica]